MIAGTDKAVLLYDGLCGMCNGVVQWSIHHDGADRLRFAPQQSAVAEELLARFGVSVPAAIASNSVYLVVGDTLLTQSDVTVRLLSIAGGPWSWLGRLLGAVPSRLRNAVYRVVARNRFLISRRFEVCPLPPPALREKFLS